MHLRISDRNHVAQPQVAPRSRLWDSRLGPAGLAQECALSCCTERTIWNLQTERQGLRRPARPLEDNQQQSEARNRAPDVRETMTLGDRGWEWEGSLGGGLVTDWT